MAWYGSHMGGRIQVFRFGRDTCISTLPCCSHTAPIFEHGLCIELQLVKLSYSDRFSCDAYSTKHVFQATFSPTSHSQPTTAIHNVHYKALKSLHYCIISVQHHHQEWLNPQRSHQQEDPRNHAFSLIKYSLRYCWMLFLRVYVGMFLALLLQLGVLMPAVYAHGIPEDAEVETIPIGKHVGKRR